MKKRHHSLGDQLKPILKKLSDAKSKLMPISSSSIDSSIKKKTRDEFMFNQCKDLTSDYFLLAFLEIEEAIKYRENLWDCSMISTREGKCEKCDKYHLYDIQNLPLIGNAKKIIVESNENTLENLLPRDRCPICKSADGKSKAIFLSVEDAQQAIDKLRNNIPEPSFAYKCPNSRGIHLTKNPPERAGQYLAQILQTRFSKSTASSKSPIQSVNNDNVESNVVDADKDFDRGYITNNKIIERILCKNCGYRANVYVDRKCAMCGSFGPYKVSYKRTLS